MKTCLKIALFLFLPVCSHAQQSPTDSLKQLLASPVEDSVRYNIYRSLYNAYEETNRDSAFYYAKQNLQLAGKHNKKLAEAYFLANTAYQLIGLGRYAESLRHLLEAFKIVEDPKNDNEETWALFSRSFAGNNRLLMLAYCHHIFGILMFQTDNREQEIIHYKAARIISTEINHPVRQMMATMNLGNSYLSIQKLDSALAFENEAEKLAIQTNFQKYLGQVYTIRGNIYYRLGQKAKALEDYYRGVKVAKEQNNMANLTNCYTYLTNFYLEKKEKDSALYYALKNQKVFWSMGGFTGVRVNLGTIYENIYLSYKLQNQPDSTFKYQGITLAVKDSLYKTRIKNLTKFQAAGFDEQLRLQNVEKEKSMYQNKVRTYTLLAGLGVFLLIAVILYRNNRQKQKVNKVLEQTLNDLKSTQTQLIQSEKMASLGELTAGIAHEIQNPLNFVNNFSEVNAELLAELEDEVKKGNLVGISSLTKGIIENEQKINHHGKRAGDIVKGMLQHSRTSSGQKELTDINALADEYLRLAYHGLKAKDKSFNAKFETNFDPKMPKVNVVPQDIGRVILNLINNAFYAVSEKSKQTIAGYEPTITISTVLEMQSGISGIKEIIKITVKDNGNGIPEKIKDKIFQPFFTTKPTGQGTGLGLSLSYDIVKAHGGEIKVKANEGTEFTIQLPI